MNEKKSLSDEYAEFMGMWIGGSAVGSVLGKIAAYVIMGWLVYKYILN